jgi:hypothetical protein
MEDRLSNLVRRSMDFTIRTTDTACANASHRRLSILDLVRTRL